VDHGLGDVRVLSESGASDRLYSGIGSASWTGDDRPEFVLTVHSGMGDVEVSRG
jgi:hypothetical protein